MLLSIYNQREISLPAYITESTKHLLLRMLDINPERRITFDQLLEDETIQAYLRHARGFG